MKKNPQKQIGYGVASLILGTISVINIFFSYGFGAVAGILAILLYYKQRQVNPNWTAITGLAFGILGLIVSGLQLLWDLTTIPG